MTLTFNTIIHTRWSIVGLCERHVSEKVSSESILFECIEFIESGSVSLGFLATYFTMSEYT